MTATGWPVTSFVCQVYRVGTDQLTCPEYESGGYRCEVLGDHERHAWGEHSVRHARSGNGYSCEAIEKVILTDPWGMY